MKNLTGEVFGKLTVVSRNGKTADDLVTWNATCECGNTVVRTGASLLRARKKGVESSCGCSHHLRTHGLSKKFEKLKWVWTAMKQRCRNPSCKDYPNYGGRGIDVCGEWDDFEVFHSWAISSGYSEGVTIERINVNQGYHPDNCTWICNEKQALNTRKIRRFEYRGEMMTLREISEECGVRLHTLKTRLMNLGWSIERATTEPATRGKNQTYNKKAATKC
ncbi:HNH endonuclease [Edwardsiella phage PEi21]|uniref:Uncharacterized protein n=1 Tax=Edwardsiella phage PEi21 TaxID=1325372 RepID=N0DPG8_9CAUD|nr:HNH endonuclease [Edwardsiella phage PEi21]BAN16870.1 hypothetical protein [Edwardsiella phage PEi21]